MPKFHRVPALLVLCILSPNVLQGQAQPIITDRPDFTESPFAVPLGSVQIEAGIIRQSDDEIASTSGPEALVRWSPTARMELRFQLPGYASEGPVSGFTDAGFGLKVEIGDFKGWSLGVIASMGLPTGDEATSAGGMEPSLILAAGRDLSEAWTVGTQASIVRPAEGGGVVVGSTLVAGRMLTHRVGAFVEIAAEREPGARASALVHAGLTFLISPTLQLDLHAARRGSAPVRILGLGLSTRFD